MPPYLVPLRSVKEDIVDVRTMCVKGGGGYSNDTSTKKLMTHAGKV
jgi:hypothetical protein